MKILIHLDPLCKDANMIQNRLEVYSEIASTLCNMNCEVKVYLDSTISNYKNLDIDKNLIIEESWEEIIVHNYESLAYANNLPADVINIGIEKYKKISFTPDLIITNTPSSLIRKIWKNVPILHYELGIFSRNPFPMFYQFDPLGYYHSSILSKFPILYDRTTSLQRKKLIELRFEILDSFGLKESEIGTIDATYVPAHSLNWTTKTEYDFTNRTDFIINYANLYKNSLIITNEKPQSPFTALEREELADFKNIEILENHDIFGLGGNLTLLCKKTYTFSPSIGLQTILWGNDFETPIQSSMINWAKIDNNFDKLATYVDLFNTRNFDKIVNNFDIWTKFNPYRKY